MKRKRVARRQVAKADLSLTSIMDMMTIILVFLLKSFGVDDITVQASDELEIPISSALAPVRTAVNIVVSQRQILVDGTLVVELEQVQNQTGQVVASVPVGRKKGQLISDLYDVLNQKAEVAKEIADRTQLEQAQFKGQVLLQCHRALPFSLVREVMYTAGQAQFSEFKFVVVKAGG